MWYHTKPDIITNFSLFLITVTIKVKIYRAQILKLNLKQGYHIKLNIKFNNIYRIYKDFSTTFKDMFCKKIICQWPMV